MDEKPAPTIIVTDGAAAADGGSPWIRISVKGQIGNYRLDRALASRGTPRHDASSGADGLQSKGERQELQSLPERIGDPGMRAGIAGTFRQVLKRFAFE
ncbi:hypothetical protein [Burkholderia pyrrocinia]|uniref:hypothetical protein n=1 Tax=Burkholderia pyrrocinia TaxID=60550 RepID=UPI002AAF1BCF|nr:hypothetical protein [Burkholderia pyrrocinia]